MMNLKGLNQGSESWKSHSLHNCASGGIGRLLNTGKMLPGGCRKNGLSLTLETLKGYCRNHSTSKPFILSVPEND